MKKNSLVVFVTTSQSPHLEALIKYAQDSISLYEEVYVVDLLSSLRYRHELSFRSYLPISLNLSRFIRNGLNKKLFFFYFKRKDNLLNHIDFFKLPQGSLLVDKEDIYNILNTYSCTEWKAPALRINKHILKIQLDIVLISRKISSLFSRYKFDKEDDFLVFNGRLSVENTIVSSLTKLGCKNIIYHECNNYQHKVIFTRNKIHDMSSYYEEICQYYEGNKDKLLDNYYKYTKVDRADEEKSNIITYFTNSTDEFQFAYSKPIKQSKIVSDLLEADFSGFSLRVRVHPGTRNKSKKVKNYWDRVKAIYPEKVVNYDENISSYKLCKKSKLTISIGSSLAAESIILGTPHVLIGRQNWQYRFPGYILCDENDFLKVIKECIEKRLYDKKRFSIVEKKLAAATYLFKFKRGDRIDCAPFGKFPVLEQSLDFLD